MKRIVVKVGSNVLTRDNGKIDVTRLSAIADQIVWLRQHGHQVILVSSGAVACGRGEMPAAHPADSVEQRQLFSAVGQVKLMELYYDLFREHGVRVGQVLTMKKNFATPEERQNQKACVTALLDNGVLPIVNENDTVSITELMFTDNDELSGLMATMMDCDELVLLTNVDGVYDGDPTLPTSRVIPVVQPGQDLNVGESKSACGRGGMSTKAGTASRVAAQGIRVVIANGTRPNVLVDLVTSPQSVPHTEFACGHMPSDSVTDQMAAAKRASQSLPMVANRDELLRQLADMIEERGAEILQANQQDLDRMQQSNPLYDRLQLTPQRLADIAADMRRVAGLPSPLGTVTKERTLPNGLHLRRQSVPYGVVGVVYEARPNVTFDVFSLCFKTGNACVLKGGRDARCTNQKSVALIRAFMEQRGVDPSVVELLPPTHHATDEMLAATGLVDLCIPRGGKKLINAVRDNAKVPVIETGAGVVHCYVHADADVPMAARIIDNTKTRRPSVCNSLDTLIVHSHRLPQLPELVRPLVEKGVTLHADERALPLLSDAVPATPQDWDTEWMSLHMGIRVVDSLDEALAHIATHGSGHSESIVTASAADAAMFQQRVDAACVYANAPTSFTDGGQFGMGAEIGISTQKLGARGPMALEELTTYKWLIDGNGQIR